MSSNENILNPVLLRRAIIGISFLCLFLPASVHGQDSNVEYYGESLWMNNIGMSVLGSWTLVNISIGAYGWSQQSGQRAFFHQMNLFWNTVNLSIAGFALYGNLTSDYGLQIDHRTDFLQQLSFSPI